MKKKILYILSACIFALALTFSFNFVKGDHNGVSLENVTIMAEAQAFNPCPAHIGDSYCQYDEVEQDCRTDSECRPVCLDNCK